MDIHIPTMLLVIGFLTTPTRTTGVTLNEYWAWVRYLNAATNDTDLRLSDDFWGLDSHQKMVLSDDFGMGISMYWLAQNLQLQAVADGRYFIERISAAVGATAVKTSKRGPNKSPDFVARDTSGTWHVVECKGTQSGDDYRDNQLDRALTQKSTVIFPPANQGQRLACGLSITKSSIANGSSLRIVDPPIREEKSIEIRVEDIDAAIDTTSRSVVAASLKLAGFYDAAYAIASPFGEGPSVREGGSRRRMRARSEFVQQRRKRAEAELSAPEKRPAFTLNGETFVGREVRLVLPRPITIDSKEVNSVTIQQGVNKSVIDALRVDVLREETSALLVARPELDKPVQLAHGEREGSLRIGELFVSHIELNAS